MSRSLRYLWASPATLPGLALSLLALRGGRITVLDGAVEAHGPLLAWALTHLVPLRGGAGAITLGHVVLGRNAVSLDATRAHERVHVAQYERWGPLFVPAYAASAAWALLTGRHPYFDNVFEREAEGLRR